MMYPGVPVHLSGLSVLFPGEDVRLWGLRQPGACCVLSASYLYISPTPIPRVVQGNRQETGTLKYPKGFLVTLRIEVKTFSQPGDAKVIL